MKKRVSPSTAGAGGRFTGIDPASLTDAEQDALVALAIAVLQARHRPGELLTDTRSTRDYLRLLLGTRKHEVFGAVFLDNRHRVLAVEELFQGTIDGASIHPRVVVQRAMATNAAALVMYHNHPSGIAEPSRPDEEITRRLRDALALVDVRVLDHIIVGIEDCVSLAELGLL